VAGIFLVVSMVLYKLFSGTWGRFYKSQTKLTNMRAASLLLEYLKHDIRMATVPTDDPNSKYELSPPKSDLNLKFQITDGYKKKIVRYTYNSGSGNVERTEDNKPPKRVNLVKIAAFEASIQGPKANQYLKILIKVDADKDEKSRSASSIGNQMTLEAILFPRFFKNFSDPEEKYWNYARNIN